jgi:hypothetical protein
MGVSLRIGFPIGVMALLAAAAQPFPAQTSTHRPPARVQAEAPAAITKVRVLLTQNGPPAVEVTSTRAVTPQIQKAQNPDRLVIDLPNTVMSVRSKTIDVKSDQVSGIRLNQFRDKPPTVRVVIDLLKPSEYSSTAAGNILTVRLSAPAVASQSPQPPTVSAFTKGVEPAVIPVSPGSNGAILMAGSRIADGSAVSAGSDTAVLRLQRGGEIRLCPGTTVSVTQSKNGRDLLLGMGTGAIETHYSIAQSSDAILTPDFRILLAGPGEFQYAFSADSKGNTCVRALPGNTAPIIVSELMGDGSYQVKPSEQVLFHAGKLTEPGTEVPTTCGCPPPPVPVLRAANDSAPVVPESKAPTNMRLARPEDEGKPIQVPNANAGVQSAAAPSSPVTLSVSPETAPVPAAGPNEVHVEVEAPFVFRADTPAAPPAPITEARQLPVADMQRPDPAAPPLNASPPPQKSPDKEHRGVMGKIKGFFSSMFH